MNALRFSVCANSVILLLLICFGPSADSNLVDPGEKKKQYVG